MKTVETKQFESLKLAHEYERTQKQTILRRNTFKKLAEIKVGYFRMLHFLTPSERKEFTRFLKECGVKIDLENMEVDKFTLFYSEDENEFDSSVQYRVIIHHDLYFANHLYNDTIVSFRFEKLIGKTFTMNETFYKVQLAQGL